MTQKLIPVYDTKKALTKAEFSEVLEVLSEETEVNTVSSTSQIIDGKKQYFYTVVFKKFEMYPIFIGSIHKKYGRSIEISTNFNSDNNNCLTLFIRGYAKELKK